MKKEANVRISNQGDQEGETAVQLELLLLQILVRAVFKEVGEAVSELCRLFQDVTDLWSPL